MVSFTIFGKRLQIFNESNQTTRIIKFPFTNRLFKTSFLFGMVITFSLMVDWIFAFSGVGHLFVIAVYNADYFIVSACLFSISLLFAILVTISLLFNLRVNMRKHQICEDLVGPPLNDQNDECISIKNNDIKKIQQLKLEFNALVRFLLKKLNSPFTVIGLWIIICAILISIFPQILTPYTLDEANGLYSPWYGFPSPDHLLGTTIYGRDVLVRIIFGVRNSLFFGISTVAIGLLGGLICGILINFIKRRFNISLEGVLIPVYMYPIMLSVLFGTFGLRTLLKTGTKIEYTVLVFGLLMIPIFIQLIANSKLSLLDISKKIISNAPLFMGFVLMINFFLEFLGFSDWKFIQLGNEVLYAREYLYNAPWASFYPNLAQFFLLFGLFLLHMGLREAPMEQQKLQRN
jgi:peptide/nickel transport system permease protein